MSSRLVVHIGLMKTGTTAVQQFVAANAGPLAAHGVRWTAAVPGPNHIGVPLAFADRAHRAGGRTRAVGARRQGARRARIATRLGAELAAGDTVLVSSEHFPLLRGRDELHRLADVLHGLADDVTVVAVVRRGDHWLPSSYAEAVLNGVDRPLDAAFVQWRRDLLDHTALVARWVDAFGADAVRVLPFLEADKGDPLAVPARLLQQLGVGRSALDGLRVPPGRARTSLGAAATETLRALDPLLPPPGLRPGRERQRLTAALAARVGGPGVALTPTAAAELERCGWVTTGVDRLPQAIGAEDWQRWRDQPPAPVRPAPVLDAGGVRTLLAELQAAGVVPRVRRVPAAVRRAAAILRG